MKKRMSVFFVLVLVLFLLAVRSDAGCMDSVLETKEASDLQLTDDDFGVSKQYLPTVSADLYYGSDGLLYGPDMESNFVGNPGGTGYVCGTTAIVTAANHFLNQFGSNFYATAMNNVSPQILYDFLDQETPVLVWVTIGMAPRSEIHGWYTEEGGFMEWAENDHGAVLIGYNDTSVIIADPILGEYSCDKEAFETVFSSRGNKCVVLQKNFEN